MRIDVCGIGAVLLLAGAAAGAGPCEESCALVPGGDFQEGEAGWSFTTTNDHDGDAFAFTDHFVGPGAAFGLNGDALRLTVVADAGSGGQTGSAGAQIVASRTLTVEGNELEIALGGGFEFLYFGHTGRGLGAFIEVARRGAPPVQEILYSTFVPPAGGGCDFGLSIIGTFGMPGLARIDLGAAGIAIGEEVELRVRLEAGAVATDPCQSVNVFALLALDDVSFCVTFDDADIDCDGSVGFGDLLAVLAAWGPCPAPCPADLDADGTVGLADLLAVLSGWSG